MKFNELQTTHKQSPKRVGRGIAAGQGKTAGRGTKGYGARTGSKARPGFVGGQNPIMQALPKLPGFRSHRVKMEVVYTDQLAGLSAKNVDTAALAAAGFISSPYVRVKLLNRGELKKAFAVHVQGASKSAAEAVTKAGGSVSIVARTPRPARTKAGKAEAKANKTTTKKSDK
jgi:large subunit ribosomal protein L15